VLENLKIGIMGGTFDPIHNGHLVIAQEALLQLKLNRVMFMPTGNQPFKDGKRVTPALIRAALVKTAIADNPHFSFNNMEIERGGTTYTVDTLKELKAKNKLNLYRQTETEYFLIIGADSAREFPKWKDPATILELAHLVIFRRPGVVFSTDEFLEFASWDTIQDRVHQLIVPQLDISSTNLRNRVKFGLPIKYNVPETVEREIYQRGLYRD